MSTTYTTSKIQQPVIVHAHTTRTHFGHTSDIFSTPNTVVIAVTARSSIAPAVSVVSVMPTSGEWQIQTYSYSYDGVIHTDSFCSNV